MYRNINCIISYHIHHRYTNILSLFGTKILFEGNEDGLLVLYYIEAIIVSEKISSMLSSQGFPIIVSSSVFRYIKKTTPKINEWQPLCPEPIPTTNLLLRPGYSMILLSSSSNVIACLNDNACYGIHWMYSLEATP